MPVETGGGGGMLRLRFDWYICVTKSIIYVVRTFNKTFYKRVISGLDFVIHVVCMYVCCPASRLMSWMTSAYNVEQESLLGFNFGLMIHTTTHMISFKKYLLKVLTIQLTQYINSEL